MELFEIFLLPGETLEAAPEFAPAFFTNFLFISRPGSTTRIWDVAAPVPSTHTIFSFKNDTPFAQTFVIGSDHKEVNDGNHPFILNEGIIRKEAYDSVNNIYYLVYGWRDQPAAHFFEQAVASTRIVDVNIPLRIAISKPTILQSFPDEVKGLQTRFQQQKAYSVLDVSLQ